MGAKNMGLTDKRAEPMFYANPQLNKGATLNLNQKVNNDPGMNYNTNNSQSLNNNQNQQNCTYQ